MDEREIRTEGFDATADGRLFWNGQHIGSIDHEPTVQVDDCFRARFVTRGRYHQVRTDGRPRLVVSTGIASAGAEHTIEDAP